MTARPSAAALARIIDHTLLKPESTADHVAALARRAVQLGTWSICVSPAMLPIEDVSMGPVKVCTVVGFPSGKHSADIKAAEAAGADFVKTSTGFHPAGGASVHAVELMATTVGGRLGVKASGGIRDYETACAMIEAGATRLGVSSTDAILAGAPREQ